MDYTLIEQYAYNKARSFMEQLDSNPYDRYIINRLIRMHALYPKMYKEAYDDHYHGAMKNGIPQTNTTPPFQTHVQKGNKIKPKKLQDESASRWWKTLK